MFKKTRAFSSFSVDDLERAHEFYRDVLGLEVSDEQMGLELRLATGGLIFIYPKSDHTPATFTILNFPVDDIEAAVDELLGKGIQFEIYEEGNLKTNSRGIFASHGRKLAWFKDPSGNFLSLVEET